MERSHRSGIQADVTMVARSKLCEPTKKGLEYLESHLGSEQITWPSPYDRVDQNLSDELLHLEHVECAETFSSYLVLHHLRKHLSIYSRRNLLTILTPETMKTIKYFVQADDFLDVGSPEAKSRKIEPLCVKSDDLIGNSTQATECSKQILKLKDKVSRTSTHIFAWLKSGGWKEEASQGSVSICFLFLCSELARHNHKIMITFKPLLLEAVRVLEGRCRSALEYSMVVLTIRNLGEVVDMRLVNAVLDKQNVDGSWPKDVAFSFNDSSLHFEGQVLPTAFAVAAVISSSDNSPCSDFFLF